MILLLLCLQNLVEGDAAGRVLEPVMLEAKDLEELVATVRRTAWKDDAESRRIQAKLAAQVVEFIEGHPWKAFHNTVGISGYESYFNHPDRVFLALSTALPFLPKPEGGRVRAFLKEQLAKSPPYALDGFENREGRAREAYDVPDALRIGGRGKASSLLGVYAFWIHTHQTGDTDARKAHWDALRERLRPMLGADYRFDIRKRDHARDEAQALNGDLAGLIASVRLARSVGDAETEKAAAAKALALLELRVNLERVNPRILERTNSTTAHLHVSKLARYCDLVPEVALALRKHAGGVAQERLRSFREARNGWHLAFGDRLIGGENYTNPPHFAHSLFLGAALVEEVPVAPFVDVPWCKGDLHFIEQAATALRVPE